MILTKLALHNFGIYGGRHEIDLTIQKDKPIILFGIQLILNVGWSALFFTLRRPDLAL